MNEYLPMSVKNSARTGEKQSSVGAFSPRKHENSLEDLSVALFLNRGDPFQKKEESFPSRIDAEKATTSELAQKGAAQQQLCTNKCITFAVVYDSSRKPSHDF